MFTLQCHNSDPAGDQTAGTMTRYPIQPDYPNIELTSAILLIPGTRLGSDKYQLDSHWFDSARIGPDANPVLSV